MLEQVIVRKGEDINEFSWHGGNRDKNSFSF